MTNFKRTLNDRWVGGVLGGLARMLGFDSTIIRIVFLVIYLSGGYYSQILFPAYLVFWFFADEG